MINVGLKTFANTQHDFDTAVDTANIGLWEATKISAAQAWNFNPTHSLWRTFEMQDAIEVSDEVLSKEELNKQYADLGLFFEKDTRKGVVDYIVERKKIENRRSQKLSYAPQSMGAKSIYLGAGLVTSFADPINIAASFIPVVREARFASWVARFGATRGRLAKGAVEGLVGNALVEPLVYSQAKSEQSEYDEMDAFLNIGFGSIIGSSFHLGFGKLGDAIAKARGTDNIYQRLAKSHPEFKEDLFRHSMTKVLNDEKVNTGEVINSTRLNNKELLDIDSEKKIIKSQLRQAKKIKDQEKIQELRSKVDDLQRKESAIVNKLVNENKIKTRLERTKITRDDSTVNPNETVSEPISKKVEIEEAEAEALTLRAKDMKSQFNKESINQEVDANIKEIEKIDNKINQKDKIRNGIKAGANCIIRSS